MADPILEAALPAVRTLAKRKAGFFVRRWCPAAAPEREDVQSQLMLRFLERWSKFDHSKSTVRTFASRVMDKELASMFRRRRAACRQQQPVPAYGDGLGSVMRRQFRVDVERALAEMPAQTREIVAVLPWCSSVEIAAMFGCSRQMVSKRKREVRRVLLAAGVGPDYFGQNGAAE